MVTMRFPTNYKHDEITIQQWLQRENIKSRTFITFDEENGSCHFVIEFQNDADAVLFKLRWCDQ